MSKFEVGDKVMGNAKAKRYAITRPGWVGYVVAVREDDKIVVDNTIDGCGMIVLAECFDLVQPVKPEKVVIYRNGRDVIAKDTNTGESEKATCSPEDEFDFGVGAQLALKRLLKAWEREQKKYFNGRVVCVESGCSWWTVGKIYDVVDGVITADDGDRYPKLGQEPYVDADDIKHAGASNHSKHNSNNTFIAIKE